MHSPTVVPELRQKLEETVLGNAFSAAPPMKRIGRTRVCVPEALCVAMPDHIGSSGVLRQAPWERES